jgi:hypothetical protein
MVQSSVEWWASALTSSTAVVGALATALGLFALAFSNKAGKLKDEAAEKAQIAADVRISEAHAKSAASSLVGEGRIDRTIGAGEAKT